MTPEAQSALDRLHNELLHAVYCPWPKRSCTCQHFADLARVAQEIADLEAATIERCAQVAERDWYQGSKYVAKQIRALRPEGAK